MKLYQFFQDFGRSGVLEGVFIARDEDIKKIMGKEIYFGEVLGKHSEVIVNICETNLECVSDDRELVDMIFRMFNNSMTISGYNPIDYYYEEEEKINGKW